MVGGKKEKKGHHISPSDHDQAKPQQILGDYCRELVDMEMRILTGWLDACMGRDPRQVQRTRYTCTTQRTMQNRQAPAGLLDGLTAGGWSPISWGPRLVNTSRLDPRETFTTHQTGCCVTLRMQPDDFESEDDSVPIIRNNMLPRDQQVVSTRTSRNYLADTSAKRPNCTVHKVLT